MLAKTWHPILVALLLLTALAGCATTGGKTPPPLRYEAAFSILEVTRPDGTNFRTHHYYPATSSNPDAPVDRSGAPYPVIVFGHGYLQTPAGYSSTLRHLASWGFHVLAPASGLSLFPSHSSFANDLRFSADFLEEENFDRASRFHGTVDPMRVGLSGHSMGGGCSLLAAAREGPRLKGVANLAAANTIPSAIDVMSAIDAPISLIAGDDDWMVPVRRHGARMYDAANAPKLLPILHDGTHTGFMDGWGGSGGEIQREATRDLLRAFFRLYLRGEEEEREHVWGEAARTDPRWEWRGEEADTSARGRGKIAAVPSRVGFDPSNDGGPP